MQRNAASKMALRIVRSKPENGLDEYKDTSITSVSLIAVVSTRPLHFLTNACPAPTLEFNCMWYGPVTTTKVGFR